MTTPTMEELAAESNALMEQQEVAREELIRDALDAIEPGDQRGGDVIHRPSGETPFGLTLEEIASAGWVRVWHTKTGEQAIVNRNMLAQQLDKRRDDGKRAFTTRDPGITPQRGTLLCLLHNEHPDKEYHASLGFPLCRKANLRTMLDVRRHMQHRHKSEWASLQEEQRRVREEEESRARKATIALAERQGGERTFTRACGKCGEVLESITENGAKAALTRHRRRCK